MFKYLFLVLSFSAIALAQRRQRPFQQPAQQYNAATTPVPILRQINTHNDDGSYTYGYEGADGSYKVETKSANGEVKGKYGYYDDAGQLREIEYGATKNGFVPSGTDVRPPVIPENTQFQSVDDSYGQYRPEVHERPYDYQPETIAPNANLIQGRSAPRAFGRGQRRQQQRQQLAQQPQNDFFTQQEYTGQYFEQQPQQYSGQYFQQQQPQQQLYQEYQPQPTYSRSPSTNAFIQPQQLHPSVPNFDLGTGSYSIRY